MLFKLDTGVEEFWNWVESILSFVLIMSWHVSSFTSFISISFLVQKSFHSAMIWEIIEIIQFGYRCKRILKMWRELVCPPPKHWKSILSVVLIIWLAYNPSYNNSVLVNHIWQFLFLSFLIWYNLIAIKQHNNR